MVTANTKHKALRSSLDTIIDESLLALHAEAARVSQPISLIEWKQDHSELDDLSDSGWLMIASQSLRAAGLKLVYLAEDEGSEPFPINDVFYDIEAGGT
ncbi:hypothetical protein [Ramlibacter alkalitolerans]|uniref:Uncharacterized protein n=1 Tax=Ramlibacter alkalitolerans TaxID=2039631 RepID=A0ABS1JMH7_9BURK|nr:hypothetical protein [Ramlibacter alkalitolerans]MBL0425403.1 hypothetical protein [Ramlibacter alkalitolerans]